MIPGWETHPLGRHLETCLEAAIAAPSVDNSQPWRFRVAAERIDVLWDTPGGTTPTDPYGREALISVGAAVLNLRVAILAAGRIPRLTLLPDSGSPHIAARLRIGGLHRPDLTVHALASAIGQRRTNRRPFRDVEVRTEVIDQLVAAARTEGGILAVADDTGRQALHGLIRTSLAQREFDLARTTSARRLAESEVAPTLVVLYTTGDSPADWLRAGQAMERVLLTATCRGVANTPMTAPAELRDLAATRDDDLAELRGVLSGPAQPRTPQVMLRLGYGEPCPPTPRRPLSDVVETAAPIAADWGARTRPTYPPDDSGRR